MRKRFCQGKRKVFVENSEKLQNTVCYFKSNLPKNANYTHSHIMLSNYSNFSHVPYKNEFHNVQGNASKYFHLAQKE